MLVLFALGRREGPRQWTKVTSQQVATLSARPAPRAEYLAIARSTVRAIDALLFRFVFSMLDMIYLAGLLVELFLCSDGDGECGASRVRGDSKNDRMDIIKLKAGRYTEMVYVGICVTFRRVGIKAGGTNGT